MGVALGLRRGTRVTCWPRRARLLGRVRLVLLLLRLGRLPHELLFISDLGRGRGRPDGVRIRLIGPGSYRV